MSGPSKTRPTSRPDGQTASRHQARLLIVEADPAIRAELNRCAAASNHLTVNTAGTLAEARATLERDPVDLLMIAEHLPDGHGLALLPAVEPGRRPVEMLLLSARPTADLTIAAMRAGVGDVLTLPTDPAQIAARLDAALGRLRRYRAPIRRVRKLRRLCRQLNRARLDISEQVDLLCSDLVTAYQQLADQMDQVVQGGEFSALIRDELDLASALRTTLEFLVQKAGPTNAAIFLPTTMDEYSLGGYVSLDPAVDAGDLLLEHLADTVAPRVGDRSDLEHLTGDAEARAWLGPDAAPLAGRALIAFAARHDDEILAVITLFRATDSPFDRVALDACASVGPLLGQALARIIRVHHRHLPLHDADTESDFTGPDAP